MPVVEMAKLAKRPHPADEAAIVCGLIATGAVATYYRTATLHAWMPNVAASAVTTTPRIRLEQRRRAHLIPPAGTGRCFRHAAPPCSCSPIHASTASLR